MIYVRVTSGIDCPSSCSLLNHCPVRVDKATESHGRDTSYCLSEDLLHERFIPYSNTSGVASMEQMEQLLTRTAQDHFCNSCRSDEVFGRLGVGVGQECNAVYNICKRVCRECTV